MNSLVLDAIPTSNRAQRAPKLSTARRWACAVVCLRLATSSFGAATNDLAPSPAELKRLSLEELMDLEVTSVSRQPRSLFTTPSAIQVITQEDIRRSGA